MIRRITLLILLISASASMAQPLYKWVESDGSITFSPTKPPAGIEFEKIEGVKAASTLTGAPAAQSAISAIRAPKPASEAQADNQPRLQYAPSGSQPLPDAISRSTRSEASSANNGHTGNTSLLTSTNPAPAVDRRTTSGATSNKQRRCQDLRKRVVSLERRLKSRLTPEDMDNTVVHMARYQRSFDQHCVQ